MKIMQNDKARNELTCNKRRRKKHCRPENDEITSSEDENNDQFAIDSSDEKETVQEKKLRVAKVYLEKIKNKEYQTYVEKGNMVENAISKRLKIENLKKAGALMLPVADQFSNAVVDNVHILKSKIHQRLVTCLCISSDNLFIFAGSKDGNIAKCKCNCSKFTKIIYNFYLESILEDKEVASIPFVKKSALKSEETVGHDSIIMCITISFNDKYLTVGDASNNIQVWNPTNLKHIGILKGHRNAVTGLKFCYGTYTLYSCSKDGSVKVWSVEEMSYVETLYGHQDEITSIDVLSSECAITSGGRDGTIRTWKIAEESHLIYNGNSESIDVVCSINEENFISGGSNGHISLWSSMKKKPLYTIKEAHGYDLNNSQPYGIITIASLLNIGFFASGSSDGFIKLWKIGEKFRIITLAFTVKLVGFVNDLKFTADGRYLIAAVGREHKFGRWIVIKSVKNNVVKIPLIKL